MQPSRVILWSFVATFPLLIVSVVLIGGGHGTYFFAKLFFPVSMILSGLENEITKLALTLGFIQFPFYGLIIILFGEKHQKVTALVILALHMILFVQSLNISTVFN